MALAEQIKKGGRYTKKEQEERRIQVYHLHFDENKSAVKIAQLLNVNRNTINDDIRYWHSQLANEIKAQDLTDKMKKQIQRMEIQRDRLLDDLEEIDTLNDKIKLEKFISEIDNRLTQLYSKMISRGITTLDHTVKPEEIDEEEIKTFVKDMILGDGDPDSEDIISEDILKFRFIYKTKCDVVYANNVLERMKRDGLVLCEQSRSKPDFLSTIINDFTKTYNLAKFAHLREYVTNDERRFIMNQRYQTRAEMERDEKEREEKFIKKYGPKSQWSEEVTEMFDDPFEDLE